jgi:predicted O-methyltransferase YrrM
MPDSHHAAYAFTDSWHEGYVRTWKRCHAIKDVRPERVLEIGVHEGRSACHLIDERMPPKSVFVGVDPFLSIEHEARARANVAIAAAVRQIQATLWSRPFDQAMADYLNRTQKPFDVLYIDGPKERDAVLAICRAAFPLVRPGGVMIFDDAYWHEDSRSVDLNRLAPAGEAIFAALAEIEKGPHDLIWHETQLALFR